MSKRVQKYLEHDFRVRYKQPIEEVTFTVCDTETTGLDLKNDTVISLGAVKIRNNRVVMKDTFEAFLRRKTTGESASIAIHNILADEVKNAPKEKKVAARFLEFLGNDVLIGHHIRFDVSMLNKILKKRFGIRLKNQYFDTAAIHGRLMMDYAIKQAHQSELPSASLDELIEKYDLPIFQRHSAIGDALMSAFLFQKLINQAERSGIKTVGSFLKPRFIHWSKYL